MKVVQSTVTYLEMRAPSTAIVPPPRQDVAVSRIEQPSTDLYRRLYRQVGEAYDWVDRLLLPDEQLRAIIQHERTDIFTLQVARQTAGYAELDRRHDHEIEIAYFGLVRPFHGQGLGRYFLNWVVRHAWSLGPRRVWLHTCDLDHPAALPTYQKAGFEVYDEKVVDQKVSVAKHIGP
jgi:GNAT superfamily N-acetyltransferase